MTLNKSIRVQSVALAIFLEIIFVTAQSFGDEEKNIQYLQSPVTYNDLVPGDDNISNELENIFRNKYLNNGTRKYKSNRSKVALQNNEMKSKEESTDSARGYSAMSPQMSLCPITTITSNLRLPFCWNETSSKSYQITNPKTETTGLGPTYVWNFNNINYNFYFPFADVSSLQQLINASSNITGSGSEKKEDMKNIFINPPRNTGLSNFTNINNILSNMSRSLSELSNTNTENSNETSMWNDKIISPKIDSKLKPISKNLPKQIIPETENSKDDNNDANDPLLDNDLKQNNSFPTLNVTTEIALSTQAHEDVDEILLRDIKTSITQMHSNYFSVVSKQISQKSRAGLGRDTLSFVISPLWLVLTMIQLSTGARGSTLEEIERVTQFCHSNEQKLQAVRLLVSQFPKNTRQIRLFGYTRLTVDSKLKLSSDFQKQAYSSMGMNVSSLDMEDIEVITKELNEQVQNDTENCMRRSFDASDLEYERPRAALWNAAYLRASWRASPTVLNDTSAVHLVNGSTAQLRMYRLNDVMRIATVNEWNATVLEMRYKMRRLRQVIVMPHDPLNLLAMEHEMMKQSDLLGYLEPRFKETRVEVTLPKYTLEMTLLLPTKLKEMGMGSSVTPEANFGGIWSGAGGYITHAVQHVKFWAEEGRGAFKDDGLVWDPDPDVKLKVDNPYFFLVRLDDVILMSGHFAI